MFPFTPRYISQARLLVKDAKKIVAYRKDVAAPELLADVESCIQQLEEALHSKNREAIYAKTEKLDRACCTLAPQTSESVWSENVEVFVVAVAVVLGIRAYFVQPFTIPTGSMQPTLNGIHTEVSDSPPPSLPIRVFDFLTKGRTYFNLVAEREETILAVEPRFRFGIPLGLFSYSQIRTSNGEYTTGAPVDSLSRDSRCMPGRPLKPGDIIARGYSDTGDHVMVDKFSYHFISPERGDVFVFNTKDIPTRENLLRPGSPSQFYIKRLAATGGDQLRIEPPKLFLNGTAASGLPFERVMSGTLERPNEGYRGYSNGPEQGSFRNLTTPKSLFDVPPNSYFALGDNSYHSSDSRDWGVVPEKNVVGKGWLVYWPFTRHWGFVN